MESYNKMFRFSKDSLFIAFFFLKRDLEYYLRDVKSFIIFLTVFLSGLLVFLVSLKNMLGNSEKYFLFLLIGYLSVSYMNISASAGFEIINDSYEGKLEYDKTLPIKRRGYSFIRIIGISLRGYINFLFCLVLMSPFLLNYFTVWKLVIFLSLSYVLSIIFTGFSLIPIIFTKNMTIQSVIGSLLRSYFFLGSTIFYPIHMIPQVLRPIILLNPVTWILELIRTILLIPYATKFPFFLSIVVITFYLVIAIVGGIKVLENYSHEE